MKYMIINTFFGWLCKAPLLYTSVDWIMAICELILVYIAISTYKHRRGYRYFINFVHGQNSEFGMGYITFYKKIKCDKDIEELERQLEENNNKKVKIINFVKV